MPNILGVPVVASSYKQVTEKSIEWAGRGESRTLVFANVHVIMEAFDDVAYRGLLGQADMVNPDGVPLVWALKMMGFKQASRVYGPDCTIEMIRCAAEEDIPVGFYGGSPEILQRLITVVVREYPTLKIAYSVSPPFRNLTEEEDEAIVSEMKASGARILFVGLGCPKQEKWIMAHAGRIPAVMFGVGAAFDFIAGAKKQAPRWMMNLGLEWIFRLCSEPSRLAKRYVVHNPRFVVLLAEQLIFHRAGSEH